MSSTIKFICLSRFTFMLTSPYVIEEKNLFTFDPDNNFSAAEVALVIGLNPRLQDLGTVSVFILLTHFDANQNANGDPL